jgi:hypothetical protein
MSKSQTVLVAISSSFMTLMIVAVSMTWIAPAVAAPPLTVDTARLPQTAPSFQYLSLSALAFMPVDRHALYRKDLNQQLLTLEGQNRNVTGNSNRFLAPLTLPDQNRLTGLTVFGQDFDHLGEVWLRVKRCDHQQAQCVALAEVSSDLAYNAGPFEKVSIFNELVDNSLFTYFLELELTALADSGLWAVRLEIIGDEAVAIPANNAQRWSLADLTTTFPIATGNIRRVVRICTDDLSHLPNATHYPILMVDGASQPLPSNTCVDASGYNIELRRNLSTGPSSGSYQFLR